MSSLQIAIDGPAASGKSTVARLVASRLGGFYINTGDMYRAVTWVALRQGVDIEGCPDAALAAALSSMDLRYRMGPEGAPVLCLDGDPVPQSAIRSPEVVRFVSQVAKLPVVRDWLRPRQRETCRLGTVVMEGRDIGTVVLPDASHKFFITASPEVRARRRLAQQGEVPSEATLESVAADIARRDHIDSSRAVAPLRPAADAIQIDTDLLDADQVADVVVTHILEQEKER